MSPILETVGSWLQVVKSIRLPFGTIPFKTVVSPMRSALDPHNTNTHLGDDVDVKNEEEESCGTETMHGVLG
jgi:hypothetical protein